MGTEGREMKACAIEGEMSLLPNGNSVWLNVDGVEGGRAAALLSPEQAREWARLLLVAAEKLDGQPLKLSGFTHGPVSVSFANAYDTGTER
jgi:hypothetical protein